MIYVHPPITEKISAPRLEDIIREFLIYKEQSLSFGRKKLDAQKAYNRQLSEYSGEVKHYSLAQAEKIYRSYQDMQKYAAEAETASNQFQLAEQRLQEVGAILFEATITAEIEVGSGKAELEDDTAAVKKTVTVSFNNGHIIVNS